MRRQLTSIKLIAELWFNQKATKNTTTLSKKSISGMFGGRKIRLLIITLSLTWFTILTSLSKTLTFILQLLDVQLPRLLTRDHLSSIFFISQVPRPTSSDY